MTNNSRDTERYAILNSPPVKVNLAEGLPRVLKIILVPSLILREERISEIEESLSEEEAIAAPHSHHPISHSTNAVTILCYIYADIIAILTEIYYTVDLVVFDRITEESTWSKGMRSETIRQRRRGSGGVRILIYV
jgi:hypothetical protein